MHHGTTRFATLAFALLVLGASIALAEGTPATDPGATDVPPAPYAVSAQSCSAEPTAPLPQESGPLLGAEDLFMPDPAPASGCIAEIYCINSPPVSISCSSTSPGTCDSYYGHCGTVVCNGQYQWCPGACQNDANCWNYCGGGIELVGECEFGCCNCP